MDLYNNSYLIELEQNKLYGYYIRISLILIISLILFVINFEYTKKSTLYIDKSEIIVMVQDKQAIFATNDNSLKPVISKKKFYYEAKLKLKDAIPKTLNVYETTTIFKSIIFDLRKELLNAENIQ